MSEHGMRIVENIHSDNVDVYIKRYLNANFPKDDAATITSAIKRHAATMERCAELIAAAMMCAGGRISEPEHIALMWLATAPAQEKRDE